METIRLAYSRNRHGYRAFSCELIASPRYGTIRSGFHVASGDTLEEARADLLETIAREWRAAGRDVPPLVECGRVPDAIGFAYLF